MGRSRRTNSGKPCAKPEATRPLPKYWQSSGELRSHTDYAYSLRYAEPLGEICRVHEYKDSYRSERKTPPQKHPRKHAQEHCSGGAKVGSRTGVDIESGALVRRGPLR